MSDEQFSKMMTLDVFYLAKEGCELVGFAQVGIVSSDYQEYVCNFEPNASELKRLYVVSSHHRQGIGQALIERALQDPQVVGTTTTYVTTWQTNRPALALYKKNGFHKLGAIPEYRSNGTLEGYELVLARSTNLSARILHKSHVLQNKTTH